GSISSMVKPETGQASRAENVMRSCVSFLLRRTSLAAPPLTLSLSPWEREPKARAFAPLRAPRSSPPPCGEGLGVGVESPTVAFVASPPPALRAPSPPRGGGGGGGPPLASPPDPLERAPAPPFPLFPPPPA